MYNHFYKALWMALTHFMLKNVMHLPYFIYSFIIIQTYFRI